ncbi:MAG: DNA methylase [Desulfobacterales bacterium CG2_30_60_27]|nr:MAG: DNA methylase [Desulfobacterales bacterium CG2_30_60_27]
MSKAIIPFSIKDAPALIERLLPVQKLSAEVFKERKAGAGQTLVPLGAYWKGRKPLILNKACILGCLLPATANAKRDLEIFEKLMAMDDESFVVRWKRRPKPANILATLSISNVAEYFISDPPHILPESAPVDWSLPELANVKVKWRDDITELERRQLEAQMLPIEPYRKRVEMANRPEEVIDSVHEHIWGAVNSHLETTAHSIPELVEQLGIMRFGRIPRLADTFCGSGQVPFEAARLGCEVYASDLNPVACMLTWGSFHVVGGSPAERANKEKEQHEIAQKVQAEIDRLGVETDGSGWKAKAYLYCLEVRCPQTGWMVPLIPSRILSFGKHAIAELVPVPSEKRYAITVRSGVTAGELAAASQGTLDSDGRGQDPYLIHTVDGRAYRTKISTLRGDFRNPDGANGNKLRLWERSDFKPCRDDIFQERLYAIHWMKPKSSGKKFDYKFTGVTEADLERERVVEKFVEEHLAKWQEKGWIPDMRIEPGGKTDEPIRTRGWTHWHHLFPARHLMLLGLLRREATGGETLLRLARILDYTSKLCQWTTSKAGSSSPGEGGRTGGASDNPAHVFYNQALNTFYNYGCRASFPLLQLFSAELPVAAFHGRTKVSGCPASELAEIADIFVTDPPYGDAVKYEEILEFFIAWLRKNPPPEFADWVWDSRRSLAIKGEGEDFRRGMVAAYRRMTECMPDFGLQVIMFTHQTVSIWADMANIVWASGLQVTAAWYVVTETDSAIRTGSNVKGTVLLVCRKRQGTHKTTRDDLAWEIQEEVEAQVAALTGLNQEAKGLYRDENVFEDADIQMAGYAAALRVLTRYAVIDGRDMTTEAIRPRVKGETTFVDGLIAFAVDTANQCLVPQGIPKSHWDKLTGAERFYLKMLDMEARGVKTLDNYQNFAKAFKVRDFRALMGDQRANHARLKSAIEFGRADMGEGSELHQSVLRVVLYAVMELAKNVDGSEVLAHLTLNIPNYYGDMTQRDLAVELADYLAKHLEAIRPDEASAARVLRELVKNQRLG